jgi:uncharacterized protein DUF4160
MPRISEFFGIKISMYWDDHGKPRFHAYYGEFEAVISMEKCDVTEGDLPARKLALAREWANLHKSELLSNWELARLHLPLNPIAPLR